MAGGYSASTGSTGSTRQYWQHRQYRRYRRQSRQWDRHRLTDHSPDWDFPCSGERRAALVSRQQMAAA